MNSAGDHLAVGLPHSEIRGSKGARPSPQLIAACHVLHRLSVPRHPPDALKTLDLSIPSKSTRRGKTPLANRLADLRVALGDAIASPIAKRATLEKTLLGSFGFAPSVQTGAQGSTSVTQTIHNVQQQELVPCGRTRIGKLPVDDGCAGGGERIRTDDPLLAKQVLSQLSYTPGPTEFLLHRR